MRRLSASLDIDIRETEYDRLPRSGEYVHLASKDPSAPAGRALILSANKDECKRAWDRLQGRHIKVGPDTVGVRVYNDDLEIALCPLLSGNRGRGRVIKAAWTPSLEFRTPPSGMRFIYGGVWVGLFLPVCLLPLPCSQRASGAA